nr:SDR family NAD(P)-dependent oxidoreductase [uncultured Celeribacter sp.]
MSVNGKTYWLIGASEGLGRALAQALDARGVRLILSARSEDRLAELAGGLQQARALALDVTDRAAVEAAAQEIGADIDGVIYLAGTYTPMAAQDWDADAVEQMFETNLMGAVRVLSQIVPGFAVRDRGHIVLIGSLSGHRGLPGALGYGASKAGLMHLAENLHADLMHSKVQVQCLNPGFIRTRLTEKNDFKMVQIMSPEEAADQVIKGMESKRFARNFPRPFALLFTLSHFMPLRWFQKLTGA